MSPDKFEETNGIIRREKGHGTIGAARHFGVTF
jgi:hypothetical protein